MQAIYLDHNATTPMLDEVAVAMAPWQGARFGNPASQHQAGRKARQALDDARAEIARMLGAELQGRTADRLIFTSGGTEANNLALLGMTAAGDRAEGPHQAIISAIEHPSVVGPVEALSGRGWKIDRLVVSREGVVDVDQLDELLGDQTRFVSVMLANNETGVIQPVEEIARRCAARGVPLHTDAVQAIGKVPVDFRVLGVASMTVTAHKLHGPLGIGALIARHDTPLRPILHGGFQQEGLRPGTESVALVVGMWAALAAFERERAARSERLRSLRDRLEAGLAAAIGEQIVINGAGAQRLPHTSNVGFVGLDRQALFMALDLAGVACSTGSACASGSSEPSPVLLAMGVAPAVLNGSLRFSLGATTTAQEIDEAVRRIAKVCRQVAINKMPVASG
jgi:cysteine desulfurase